MASGNEIRSLVNDPKSFLQVNRLGYSIGRDFKGEARVKLSRASATEKAFNVEKASDSEKSISEKAYLLGYKSNEKNDALFLEIPSRGVEEGRILFTYKLTGCSLVVTRGKAADTYRVFHDNRRNSAVLYDNVVMALDSEDYKVLGLFPAGTAVASMQFKQGAWKLYVQQQYLVKDPANASHPKDSKTVTQLRVVVKDIVKDTYINAFLQKSFDEKRGWMQQRIKDLAKTLGVNLAIIEKAKEACVYKGKGEFSENDPCISEWNKLRDAIEKKLLEKNKDAAEAAKLKNADIARWKTRWPSVFGNYGGMLPDANMLEFGNYAGMLHAAENLDKIWLWLQVNKVNRSKANQY